MKSSVIPGNQPSHLMSLEERECALTHLDRWLHVLNGRDGFAFCVGDAGVGERTDFRCVASAPPCIPEMLGSAEFRSAHGLKYACYAGSMAHGIASPALMEAMGRAGMLGFLGSAGLSLSSLESAVVEVKTQLDGLPYGFNLINTPGDSALEKRTVELYLAHDVRLLEVSAYITPTPSLVKFRIKGLRRDENGFVHPRNHLIAKVSRSEVARRFFEPPPPRIVEKLRVAGDITDEEAQLAPLIPLAGDVTAEADSGGHTDHRAAFALLPSVLALAEEVGRQQGYAHPIRVGLAGGIATPGATAAAFAMGAAYVVTGSVNQACIESGASPLVRHLLAQATQSDVVDAPAADMFEMGVTVQVLKKGVRFAERARKLYDLWRSCESLEAIPAEERKKIEESIFRTSLDEVWKWTQAFFLERNPAQIEKALANPKHKMALIFRWYLGNAVHWACAGMTERQEDFQIWCGPGMGAFNDWTRGSFLEQAEARSAPLVARNLLFGAALMLRLQCLRGQGVDINGWEACVVPRRDVPEFLSTDTLQERL